MDTDLSDQWPVIGRSFKVLVTFVFVGLAKASRRGPSSVQLAPTDRTVQLQLATATPPRRWCELAPETEAETTPENQERIDRVLFSFYT